MNKDNLKMINGKLCVLKESEIGETATVEAKLLKKLDNPIFPKLIAYEETDKAYMYREYIKGVTLTRMVAKRQFLSVYRSLKITLELCAGIYDLHCMSPAVICRDIKPDNIVIGEDGSVHFIDLGSAGIVGNDRIVTGTRGFSAPEQFREQNRFCNESSDIYGLSAVLFYMLVGYSPDALSDESARENILKAVYVPKRLRHFLISCLSDNPAGRCPDINTYRRMLLRFCTKNIRRLFEQEGLYDSKRPYFNVKQNIIVDKCQ